MHKLFGIFSVCLLASGVIAQQRCISGKVYDDMGQALSGIDITEKGTNKGTSTKNDGNFTFAVSDSNARIVISFIRFNTKEVEVKNPSYTTVTLTLHSFCQSLNKISMIFPYLFTCSLLVTLLPGKSQICRDALLNRGFVSHQLYLTLKLSLF